MTTITIEEKNVDCNEFITKLIKQTLSHHFNNIEITNEQPDKTIIKARLTYPFEQFSKMNFSGLSVIAIIPSKL